jgi:amidase
MSLFFQVAFAGQPWRSESALVNIPWRPVDQTGKGLGFDGWSGAGGKMRVGVIWSDGHVRPVKPIRRALEAVSRALKQSGDVELQDVDPLGFVESSELTVSCRCTLKVV